MLVMFFTENFRRSSRVPNRSKRFEAMYESHLLAGTTEGLEVSN